MNSRVTSNEELTETTLLPTPELWRAAGRVNEGSPGHWELVRVGEVAEILNGFAFKSSLFNEKHGVLLVRIRDLSRDSIGTFYDGPYDARYIVTPGSLLIGMDGDFRCVEWKGPPALLNQRVCKLSINPSFLHPQFVLYGINRHLKAIQNATSSLTVTHISSQTIATIPFPLPPRAEQDRIVAKIEELFQELRTAKQALQKVPSIIKQFRQSVLVNAFRGELTERDPNDGPALKLLERIRQERRTKWEEELRAREKDPTKYKYEEPEPVEIEGLPEIPDTWVWTTIEQLATFIGSGITPLGGQAVYASKGIPFIRSQNVYPDGLHLEDIVYVTARMHAEMKRTRVHPRDVLLNITGASIGRSTFLPEDFGEANVNQHVCIIRTGWWIEPAYLSSFLNSPFGQDQIFSTESGVTREGLNYGQIRSFKVPLAPLGEQKRVVSKIANMLFQTDTVGKAVLDGSKQTQQLEQSILFKAFRGELVPQHPTDEPASVLLERIRAQRAMMVKRGKHHV